MFEKNQTKIRNLSPASSYLLVEFANWCSDELSKKQKDFKIDVINVNNKKCAPKLVFFDEKKIEKDSYDFRHRKLIMKVEFWHFLTPPHYTNSQNSITSFEYVDF